MDKGKNPLKQLQETLHNLEKAGAEIIAMPCNTAHHYYSELQESTSIPKPLVVSGLKLVDELIEIRDQKYQEVN